MFEGSGFSVLYVHTLKIVIWDHSPKIYTMQENAKPIPLLSIYYKNPKTSTNNVEYGEEYARSKNTKSDSVRNSKNQEAHTKNLYKGRRGIWKSLTLFLKGELETALNMEIKSKGNTRPTDKA